MRRDDVATAAVDAAVAAKGGAGVLLQKFNGPAQDRELPSFRLLSANDLRGMPPMQWAVRDVLPAEGLAVIYGPSGSGKSFLEIDLVAAMAEARDWFGYRIPRPLRVVVVVLEGAAGFCQRVRAWESDRGATFPAAVRFVFQPFRLHDRDQVLGLAASVVADGDADAVFIDTLNRATPGADENSAVDTSKTIEATAELQVLLGGLVVLVAHTGKDATKGLRGHSSLIAALDSSIEVSRGAQRREWTAAKVKDGRDGAVHGFRLEDVDLGHDDEGEPITSCVVRPDLEPAHAGPRPPTGGHQRIVWDALGPLFREARDYGKAGAPPTKPCIRLQHAIEDVRDRLAVDPKRRNERARAAITGLAARRLLACNEDWLWQL